MRATDAVSGAQAAIGKNVTARTVFWNVVEGITAAVAGGPAVAFVLSEVARRLISNVISIAKGIAAEEAIGAAGK